MYIWQGFELSQAFVLCTCMHACRKMFSDEQITPHYSLRDAVFAEERSLGQQQRSCED